jgi:hypothetical protein
MTKSLRIYKKYLNVHQTVEGSFTDLTTGTDYMISRCIKTPQESSCTRVYSKNRYAIKDLRFLKTFNTQGNLTL